MKIQRHEREPIVAVPVAQIQAEAAAKQAQARRDMQELQFSLHSIQDMFQTHKAPRIQESIESFDVYRLWLPGCTRPQVKTARFTDALLVLGTTPGFLEDRAHRLIIPTEGDALYGRTAIHVDSQKLPSPDVHLEGVEAIAGEQIAFRSIAYLAGAVAIESSYGWRRAIDMGELERIHLPVAVPA